MLKTDKAIKSLKTSSSKRKAPRPSVIITDKQQLDLREDEDQPVFEEVNKLKSTKKSSKRKSQRQIKQKMTSNPLFNESYSSFESHQFSDSNEDADENDEEGKDGVDEIPKAIPLRPLQKFTTSIGTKAKMPQLELYGSENSTSMMSESLESEKD